jgi:hypothetical protein
MLFNAHDFTELEYGFTELYKKILEKVYFKPPQLWAVDYLTPSTMKRSILSLNSLKPVKLPQTGLKRHACYSNREIATVKRFATVPAVLSFLFIYFD